MPGRSLGQRLPCPRKGKGTRACRYSRAWRAGAATVARRDPRAMANAAWLAVQCLSVQGEPLATASDRDFNKLTIPIPGVNRRGAELILAEIGVDMTRFGTAPHLAAWVGVAPGNNDSAGKQRSSTTRKGNQALRAGLTQLAQAAAHTKETYLSALYGRTVAALYGRSACPAD